MSMSSVTKKVIHADATKDFFLTMITRDITLRDCIFDLLDNSIDGARRSTDSNSEQIFAKYKVSICFDAQSFVIDDNCGGISLSDAIDYAFHFGRRPDSPSEVKGGIGLYGIGMKRAIFKIGAHCEVISHASDASFKVIIDVPEWRSREEWDFAYEDISRSVERGTRIQIRNLTMGASELLGGPKFKNDLVRDIARDYAFFIQKGLTIDVCGDTVPSYRYELIESSQVAPFLDEYEDDGVRVRIMAGLVDAIPDDIPDELRPGKVDRFGWFVICNDRVVLAADKSERTVWGRDNFNVWHPQYNGFAGFVFYQCDDQEKLPWTTTKRELDASSPLYRRTVKRMQSITTSFIDYTNRRKVDLEAAHAAEAPVRQVNVTELKAPQPLRLPSLRSVQTNKPPTTTIAYSRPKSELDEIRDHLGNILMTNKDIGILTFEHFRRTELGK
jgi:hypothetical protein